MSLQYIIKQNESDININWDTILELKVSNYPWDINGYKPEMFAKMCYSKSSINILMYAFEKYPRATFHSINDMV